MTTDITVYWRPGCMFCAGLFHTLERRDVPVERRNIWQDEQAAADVRRATGGDETVPTVQIGDVFLVNPSVDHILRVAHELDPSSPLPEPTQPGRIGRLIRRTLGMES